MDLATVFVAGLSMVVALASLLIAYRTWVTGERSINALYKVRDEIDMEFSRVKSTNEDTQSLIAKITRLFDASKTQGLEMVYRDRMDALREFEPFISDEQKEVVIIGSSLLGLYMFIPGFDHLVQEQPDKFRVILTHPDESQNREDTEGRMPGAIRNEIMESIRRLQRCGVPVENIQLYGGAPSVFMIAASGHMLLNPYPYRAEAFHNFCVQVSDHGPGSIYHQYYENHYRKVWDTTFVQPASDFLQALPSQARQGSHPRDLGDPAAVDQRPSTPAPP